MICEPPGFAATLLQLADQGRTAVKTLRRLTDGSIASTDYDHGFQWLFRPFDAGADFDRMAAGLRLLGRRRRTIACMGAPRPGLDLTAAHRRLWARSDAFENTMLAVPRAWLAIDVDDAPVPRGLGAPGRYVEGAIHIRDTILPEEFHGVTTVASPSARTGLRGPALLRCRMWLLLDRPYELQVLKLWTRGLKAVCGVGDSAICQAAQPIFTGRPLFAGMDDPIPPSLWAVVARGQGDRVKLAANRFGLAVTKIDRAIGMAAVTHREDWRGFLSATVGGELSFFEPLSRGLGIAARSGDADGAIVAFTLGLIKQRADPGRVGQYDAEWIGGSLRRFRERDACAKADREAAVAELYEEKKTA